VLEELPLGFLLHPFTSINHSHSHHITYEQESAALMDGWIYVIIKDAFILLKPHCMKLQCAIFLFCYAR